MDASEIHKFSTEIIGCLDKVVQFRYLGVEIKLFPSKAAKAMQQRALSISKKYKEPA